ncbi:SulP family inorganic anion transporter [Stutzerimonas tarimensis]|uniref:SulP family inorganic anion transporter n=1 Tax=Stutzerimonas tarimensis TaxID=1507735 RepID=A0ABV7T877_9GAMM
MPNRFALFPFLRWWPRVGPRSLGQDALVGLTGAILALPQSIAYALIAGLPAEYGLYAAIVPVIIACLWGSSLHLIGGPTAAISVVLFASISPLAEPGSAQFIQLVLLLSFMAGAFQLVFGLLRFGALVNFVSQPVLIGFTLGAALVIALGQVPNLLGIEVQSQATAVLGVLELGEHLGESHGPSLLVAALTLAVALLVRRYLPRFPALLLAILTGSLLVWSLPGVFAGVPLVAPFEGSLPPLTSIRFNLDTLLDLVPAAVAIGLLGLVTSLSIARALAAQSGQVLDADTEVRGQGISNLIGPWFSGYLSAGSFTRSALNLQAGAQTPLAGVASALLVALFALLGARLVAHIPLPAMGAGILLICWGLVDRRGLRSLWRISRPEFAVMAVTCAATLLLELQTAIYAGMLASLAVYLKRTSRPRLLRHQQGDEEVLTLEGSIFFGASPYLQRQIQRSHAPRVVIDAHHVNFVDYAGMVMLHDEARRLAGLGRKLVVRRARPVVADDLRKLDGVLVVE